MKNDQGRLANAPYVDNSYKWAGGGFLSTARDLCHFGDAMLYSMQFSDGYLKPETMRTIWQPVEDAPCGWDKDGKYAMGWCSIPQHESKGPGRDIRQYMSHTGAAVGASSVLLIMPRKDINNNSADPKDSVTNGLGESGKPCPKGVTVAVAVNMQGVGLNKVAIKIAKIFDEAVE